MEKLILILALCLALAGCGGTSSRLPAVTDSSGESVDIMPLPDESQTGDSSTPAAVGDPVTPADSSDGDSSGVSQSGEAVVAKKRVLMLDGILWYESAVCEAVGRCGMMDGTLTEQVEGTPTKDGQCNFGTGYQYQSNGDGYDVYFPETEEWIRFSALGVVFYATVEEIRSEDAVVHSNEGQWNENSVFSIPLDKIDKNGGELAVGSVLLINCGDSVLEIYPALLDLYAVRLMPWTAE